MTQRFIVYIPPRSHWGAGQRLVFATLEQAKAECAFWFARAGLVLAIKTA